MSDDNSIGLLILLITGSYVYITGGLKWLSDKMDTLRDNHIAHLVDRVKKLENDRDSRGGQGVPGVQSED